MKMAFLKQFIARAQTQSSSPVLETSQVFFFYKPIELVKYVKLESLFIALLVPGK